MENEHDCENCEEDCVLSGRSDTMSLKELLTDPSPTPYDEVIELVPEMLDLYISARDAFQALEKKAEYLSMKQANVTIKATIVTLRDKGRATVELHDGPIAKYENQETKDRVIKQVEQLLEIAKNAEVETQKW